MLDHHAEQAIGIFDSGSGGLTLTRSISQLLPFESLIYFGDTAHAPWGDKSVAAIQGFSLKIVDVLLKHGCKCIIIACHTASAVAYERVKEHVGNRAMVINVIDPVMSHLKLYHDNQKIGLIGTKQTVRSNIYQKRFDELSNNLKLVALATPLLVPLIEEGFADHQALQLILSEYLNSENLKEIDALILGCTHYPFIKQHISEHYQSPVTLIDAADIVATHLKEVLVKAGLLRQKVIAKPTFYVSDYNEFFEVAAGRFFGQHINLEPYPLWE